MNQSNMRKNKKIRKINKIEKKKVSLAEKMLIIFVEVTLLCDLTLYPIPVKAAELQVINEANQKTGFTIQDKIIEMETSHIEINKALAAVEAREKKIEDEIRANQARLQAEIENFKRDQAEQLAREAEEEKIKQEAIARAHAEEARLVAEARAEEERIKQEAIAKTQAAEKNRIKNQQAQTILTQESGTTIINLPRGVKVYTRELPQDNKEYRILWQDYRTFTGYNSDPWQTDDTPCIAANGFDVCKHGIEDTVAANFLKFGTKIRIPEKYGDRVFTVRDRMNRRYPNSVDIWMIHKQDAKEFGRRRLLMQVVQEVE